VKFEGVYVANPTFFDKGGSVNFSQLQRHLEWLVASGVHGFVPCGTTGEGSTLTISEREAILVLARQIASERNLKVIAGCGSNVTSTVLELVEQARSLGCDGVLVVSPYYNKPTPAGIRAHFLRIADQSLLPILLYNVPGRTAAPIPIEVTKELLQHPNIIGIKESSGQYGQWLQLAHDVDWRYKSLLAGDDDAMAVIGALGGCGIISASANVIPKVFVLLHQFISERRIEEAFRLQVRINPILRTLFLETNPAPLKHLLHHLMGFEPYLRLPLVSVAPETAGAIEASFAKLSKELELL